MPWHIAMKRLIAALFLLVPTVLLVPTAAAQPGAVRTVTGEATHIVWQAGAETIRAAERRDGVWTEHSATNLRWTGAMSVPVQVSVTGLMHYASLFAVCGDETVYSEEAQPFQTLDLPPGVCEVGVLHSSEDADELIVREIDTVDGGPVTLALDGPLFTATVVLRDENGAPLSLSDVGSVQQVSLMSRGGGAAGTEALSSFRLSVAPLDVSTLPRYRYSVDPGLDYRFDWALRSWTSSPVRYVYKGRIEEFGADQTFENEGSDLASTIVDFGEPEATGFFRSLMTTAIRSETVTNDGVPFVQNFNWHLCDAPVLPPPHIQQVYAMADPATDFLRLEGSVSIALDYTTDVWERPNGGPQPAPCSDLAPEDRFVVAPPALQRHADGVTRVGRGATADGPTLAVGDTLRHGLAPLAFTARLDRLIGPRFWPGVFFFSAPPHWPLPEGTSYGTPLVHGQLSDSRAAKMPYEVVDPNGSLLTSGPDLSRRVGGTLPYEPATVRASYLDPVVRVGGRPAGVEIEMDYYRSETDVGPPAIGNLTLEADGAFTSTVAAGTGVLRFAVDDFSVETSTGTVSVDAAVRPTDSDGPWTPLPLVEESDGAYRVDLDLTAGLYDLRIQTADAAGNAARHISTPAFEVAGMVASEPGPAAWHVGPPVPNPAQGHATIQAHLSTPGLLRAEVVDALGRRAQTAETECAVGACAVRVSLDGLAPGVYSVRLRSADGTAVRRLTVVR